AVAATDPQLIRALGIEHHALLSAVDLERQAVLAARGDLAHGQRREHARLRTRQQARVVFRFDDLVDGAIAAGLERQTALCRRALCSRTTEHRNYRFEALAGDRLE